MVELDKNLTSQAVKTNIFELNPSNPCVKNIYQCTET